MTNGWPVVVTLALTLAIGGCSSAEDAEGSESGQEPGGGEGAGGTAPGPSSGEPGPPFEGCAGDGLHHATLNAFWADFDERYALFDLRLPHTTWDAVGHGACDALQTLDEGDEDGLFDLLLGMGRELDDGHVQLEAESLGRDEDGWVSVYPFLDDMETLEGHVEDVYLDGELSWAAEDWFAWGTIGDVGYLSITSMDELSPSGDEDDDRQAALAAMASAVADLSSTSSMIVDLRANGGGWDTVALAVATWFDGAETLAWSETHRDGPEHDDFAPWQDVLVAASGSGAYDRPVVVLTSGATFSAAETFVLAMRVRDDVTVVGERSSGHFSDLTDGTLPNGWSFAFSGERYRAADGVNYETLGVPVDHPVSFDPAALANGNDVMLEAALALLGG